MKLAAVVQRLVASENKITGETEFGLSDEERKQLLETAEEHLQDIQNQMEMNNEHPDSAGN